MKAIEPVGRNRLLNACAGRLPVVPVVVEDEATGWPALNRWTDEYLLDVIGDRQVPVHVARGPDRYPVVETMCIDKLLKALNGLREEPASIHALAGYPLERVSTHLLSDVSFPSSGFEDAIPYLWLGPKGKTVPFHHDKAHGLLVNVRGRKRISLVAPEWTWLMQPLPQNRFLSQVRSVADQSAETAILKSGGEVQQAILHPGEGIFVPEGWWHQVEYLDACISINFWPQAYGA